MAVAGREPLRRREQEGIAARLTGLLQASRMHKRRPGSEFLGRRKKRDFV
jgi:hypothetical protein